jgi:AraC family transcriptional regulator of adaptative response/methylated-DNA-[protein]-cysteine methyltransferase
LSFVENGDQNAAWAGLEEDWPNARLRRNDSAATRIVEKIFTRPIDRNSQPVLRAFVKGTEFQVRVWRALLEIPPGQFTSYGRLAAALGQPTAARAVGTAVGQNPLAYLIPCHRVIRETGVIGNYRWGRIRKRAMVGWENARNLPRLVPAELERTGVLV